MDQIAERRQSFRSILAGPAAVQIASVFDPLSARLAARGGFRAAFFGGSVSAAVVHGTPDIGVLTLSELAEQVRRTSRASDLPLLVDGDHGFGNPMGVAWTVRELESAGAAGIAIEDLVTPQPFGAADDVIMPEEEFAARLAAAIAARRDRGMAIVAQTIAAPTLGREALLSRARLAERLGADALMPFKVSDPRLLEELAAAVALPLILAPIAVEVNEKTLLERCHVRMTFMGHQPFRIALKGLFEAYRVLMEDGGPGRANGLVPDKAFMEELLRQAEIDDLARRFMGARES
jgi:carboxyvinyl-carboxyphosphonate phosphorylmutase